MFFLYFFLYTKNLNDFTEGQFAGSINTLLRNNSLEKFKYIITPVCKECDFEPIRVDQLSDANSITQTIVEHLEQADLVIADISEHNPNVFMKLDIAQELKNLLFIYETKMNHYLLILHQFAHIIMT